MEWSKASRRDALTGKSRSRFTTGGESALRADQRFLLDRLAAKRRDRGVAADHAGDVHRGLRPHRQLVRLLVPDFYGIVGTRSVVRIKYQQVGHISLL